jgi:RNA polymerase sigma-70 factor (ECF subfamily)
MTTDECDLARCLEGARRGEQEAARTLVEQLYPLVIRIVRSHLPLRAAEEDMAQEVFLKLFSRLDQYEARAGIPFAHWVSRLVVRTCLDALRAERRRPEVRWSDLSEEQSAWLEFMLVNDAATPDTSPASTREVVDLLLSQLPPQDGLVIRLLDLEQKSVKEISQMTGWNSALVKVRAFRARHKLRKLAKALKGSL